MFSGVGYCIACTLVVSNLGSPKFWVREKTQKVLTIQAADPIMFLALQAGKSHKDLEISRRSTIILKRFYENKNRKLFDKIKSKFARWPWISTQNQFELESYNRACKEHKYDPKEVFGEFGLFRTATRIHVERLIEAGVDEVQIIDWLRYCKEREDAWKKEQNEKGTYKVPL